MSSAEWNRLLRGPTDPAAAAVRLRRAVQLGRDVAPGLVAGCSVTEIDGTAYSTPASSDQLATTLDEAQYAAGRGPCMAAARDHQVHHLEDLRTIGQFDHFSAAAIEAGVLSSLSLPLDGTYRPAALNLYGTAPGAFANQRARRVAALLARVVAAGMLQSGNAPHGVAVPGGLPAGARPRAELIHRAQQLLTPEHGSAEQAFTAMAIKSREEVRSIFDIARDVLVTAEEPA